MTSSLCCCGQVRGIPFTLYPVLRRNFSRSRICIAHRPWPGPPVHRRCLPGRGIIFRSVIPINNGFTQKQIPTNHDHGPAKGFGVGSSTSRRSNIIDISSYPRTACHIDISSHPQGRGRDMVVVAIEVVGRAHIYPCSIPFILCNTYVILSPQITKILLLQEGRET